MLKTSGSRAILTGIVTPNFARSVRADIDLAVADASGFIPIIWAQEALAVLRANLVLGSLIARDVDFEPAPRGKTLNIPYPGTFTSQLKTEATGTGTDTANVQTPAGGTTKNVTLSQFRYVDFIVDDFARAQSNGELIQRYVQPAVAAIALGVEQDLWTLYSSLTAATVGVAGTNLNHAAITQGMMSLNNALAPQNNRAVVMSEKDWAALIGDPTLATYFAFSANEGITGGKIPMLDGFELHHTTLVPTTVAGGVTTTHNIAIQKNALIMAMRPFAPVEPESGVASATLVDPLSGIAIRVLKQYDMNARGHRVGFDVLYGFAALRPEIGAQVLS